MYIQRLKARVIRCHSLVHDMQQNRSCVTACSEAQAPAVILRVCRAANCLSCNLKVLHQVAVSTDWLWWMHICWLSVKVTDVCQLSVRMIDICQLSVIVIDSCQLSIRVIDSCQLSVIVVDSCQLSVKVIDICQLSVRVIDICQLSVRVIDSCQLSVFVWCDVHCRPAGAAFVFATSSMTLISSLRSMF